MNIPEKLATKTKICVGHHYAQTNTNDVNKTRTLLQATRGTFLEIHPFHAEIAMDITTRTPERKDTQYDNT